ncbi:MAG: DUF1127 domain-containing protein [Hyphomicrobiaceae bacterium]
MSQYNEMLRGRAGVMSFALESLGNAIFGNVTQSIQKERDRRELGRELARLSDRELADIGLTRADVPRGFWDSISAHNHMFRRP